ncbi:hypothetical protein LSCM1_05294 [Leishmania martiniquensis]|uniref:Histone RNA hairpin-binding protein RNA-binding domain-containing protein n=1 Tax=Leishmania martiniquensis TaxID=1580590 RepID=A0A836KNE8_9TRYP|nr:hypothetical protein LSCM1_05294 [Leishmania martiniquensis]
MQPQQQQSVTTPQRAPQGGDNGEDANMRVKHTPQNAGIPLQDSPSQSPAPRFPSEGLFSSALQRPQQDQERGGTSLSDRRPPSSQPRERFHARQRRRQQKQQQQPHPSDGVRSQRGDGERGSSGICPDWRQRAVPWNTAATLSGGHARPRKSTPPGNSPDEERRRSQREKQIQFGYATEGYTNMKRLIAHDPLLRSGGLLPLSPPEIVKGSKRLWDIQLRKWRRALHMFDYVFIDGEDDPATRATVLEEQRQQWVSEAFTEMPREARLRIDLDTLRHVQHSSTVPRKIPVEDDLRCILRSDDCYESVRSVVPQSASSLTKGTDISPLEAGIKIHIAPSAAVLQRQQAQFEMLQRLSSLHQQQQHVLATEVAQKGMETSSHSPSAPPVSGETVECASAQRPAELSPSPRRPPLPLQATLRVSCPAQRQGACESAPHQQRGDGSQNMPSNSTFSDSSIPRTTAKLVSTAFSSAETAPGLSVSQHRALSPSGSSAPAWGASLGVPGVPPTAALLAPPPPFSGALPCTMPNTWMPGVAVSPTQAAAAGSATATVAPSLVSWCSHCGQCVDLRPHTFTGAPYGGACAGSAGTRGGMPVPPHHVNPAAMGGSSGVMMPSPAQICGTTPYMSRTTASIVTAGATYPAYWQMPTPPMVERIESRGTVATRHCVGHSQHRQLEAWQDAFAAMPTSVAGRSCPRDGRHRSSGAVAAGGRAATPHTVPRFVARLSISPNEQPLGERQSAERLHTAGVTIGGGSAATKPLATGTRVAAVAPTAQQQQPMTLKGATSAVGRVEKSQPVLTVTPERILFGVGTTAEATTVARRVVVGTQQQPDAQPGTQLGKSRATPEIEEAPVAPLVFDGDE